MEAVSGHFVKYAACIEEQVHVGSFTERTLASSSTADVQGGGPGRQLGRNGKTMGEEREKDEEKNEENEKEDRKKTEKRIGMYKRGKLDTIE